jgi:hypothetical protein
VQGAHLLRSNRHGEFVVGHFLISSGQSKNYFAIS